MASQRQVRGREGQNHRPGPIVRCPMLGSSQALDRLPRAANVVLHITTLHCTILQQKLPQHLHPSANRRKHLSRSSAAHTDGHTPVLLSLWRPA
jgi:hypothetical protein